MKKLITIFFLLFSIASVAQKTAVEIFGFRHLQMLYKGDRVDILIKSKQGQEKIKKPLFFFCQGSLPIPLMIRYKKNEKDEIANVFPFSDLDSLLVYYHLVIVGKPYIPLIVDEKDLNADMTYSEPGGAFPKKYQERNILSYYTARNISVIRFLNHLPFVSKESLVMAGHSEGSTIAAKIAAEYPNTTCLIYSGGNPLGRMMTIIARSRADNSPLAGQSDSLFSNWKRMIKKTPQPISGKSDMYKTTLAFSSPAPILYLKKLHIPVLVTFGGKDYGLINAEDYLRLELIRLGRTNFTFKEYPGLEHNFFELKPGGAVDYDKYNWNSVANDWLNWLQNVHLRRPNQRHVNRRARG